MIGLMIRPKILYVYLRIYVTRQCENNLIFPHFIFFFHILTKWDLIRDMSFGLIPICTDRSPLEFNLFWQSKECSRKCESEFCSVPPLLRYGKYCGLLYSGCPGERPCDGLDSCCMKHDACVQTKNNDYLSQECSQKFINCMNNFSNMKLPTFNGNKCNADEVIDVISIVMDAAVLAGRVFRKP
ncbi:hypothetical protein EUTSA_v10002685mg [Eutrema salsugineum]|uniref:phospholipase A2 n=1 Tax=Eutrema salsugineum TaxID=72664 RepID=V4MWV4_EUTSA|nr:phospholipase A2-alpha isoform X1 [Eutrema salsugineum]ESQ36881.1 hypothetical protein EUTSA_v10002685mg [Eutrema salsugineum]